MATFLDATGLQYFSSIFVFLFATLIVYATLSWSKVLGENMFVNVFVSLLSGIFVIMSQVATSVIADTAPFLVVALLFIVLINVATKMLGASIDSFPALKGIFLVFVLIIVVVTAGVKLRESVDVPSETGKDLSKSVNLIFHPKFLGTILIFAIAVFTIALLVSKSG